MATWRASSEPRSALVPAWAAAGVRTRTRAHRPVTRAFREQPPRRRQDNGPRRSRAQRGEPGAAVCVRSGEATGEHNRCLDRLPNLHKGCYKRFRDEQRETPLAGRFGGCGTGTRTPTSGLTRTGADQSPPVPRCRTDARFYLRRVPVCSRPYLRQTCDTRNRPGYVHHDHYARAWIARRGRNLDSLLSSLAPGGKDFERLCLWLLQNAPEYKSKLKRTWHWDEWPGRWGADAGIDLVAEDHKSLPSVLCSP